VALLRKQKEDKVVATTTSPFTDEMLDRFAERAPAYDRENRFSQEDFDELKASG
jgi:hypothetical protein